MCAFPTIVWNLSRIWSERDVRLPGVHGSADSDHPWRSGNRVSSFSISGYTTASGLHILSTENDYLLTPNLSWVHGKHTFKFGADWRDLQDTYYQTFDGGSFSFTNLFTASNALAAGASGNGLASMLLGYGASGGETAFSVPWESLHYHWGCYAPGHTSGNEQTYGDLRSPLESRRVDRALQPQLHVQLRAKSTRRCRRTESV